jgi:uncharacterized linocin/CFP29 family protein
MNTMKRVGLATGTLTDYEINQIETQIVKTVRPMLIGRTLMPTRQLPSAGFTQYTFYTENDMSQANISMTGEEQSMDVVDLTESHVHIPIISKDYHLHWREVLRRRDSGEDLNTQHAENAARQVAEDENRLIITGENTAGTVAAWPALGIQGLATATGRQTQAGGDWDAAPPAGAMAYISLAKQLLRAAGYEGPYKVIMRSAWYAQLENYIANFDKTLLEMAGDIVGGTQNLLISDDLHTAAGLNTNALVISTEPNNFELLVGADISNYLAQLPTMNYQGKVWEAVVPVIKRPAAIVEITGLT